MPSLDEPKHEPKSKRRRWLLLPVALLALPLALKALGVQSVNRASTSPESADPSLRTRFYAAPPQEVAAQVLEALPALSTYGQRWRVAGTSNTDSTADGKSSVRAQVPVLVFTDDLTIDIQPSDGGSRVDVTSASRVGQGDMGENARHVRQILSALDARLDPIIARP